MQELKEINEKVDRMLFVLCDDEKMGHKGLGTEVKEIKALTYENKQGIEDNTNDIKQLKKKVKSKNYVSMVKGLSVGGGFGAIAKFWNEIKTLFKAAIESL